MLIRLELLTPPGDLVSGRDLQQAVHHARRDHGLLLPDPGDPGGARELPGPADDRGAATWPSRGSTCSSWYIYIVGRGASRSARIVTGGVDTGWTFYTPYSTVFANTQRRSRPAVGIFITGFSSILTGLNFIVTIHKMRAPGLTWFRLPLFVWAHYATSLIRSWARRWSRSRSLLVALERLLPPRHLRPGARRRPGPVPAPVLVLLAPGGLHHDPAGHGRDQRARRLLLAQADLRLQVHRLSRAWPSPSSASWSGATTCSSPASRSTPAWSSRCSASWSRSPRRSRSSTGRRRSTRARSRCDTPMLYAFGFIGLFTIGGLTGLFLASLGLDVHVHDTYFVVAHFHYIMVGGTIMAYLGGLHFWWPKITGRMYPECWAQLSALVVFVGFNLTFFPQFVLGYLGMPRRYHAYPAGVPGAERAVDGRRLDPRRRLPAAAGLPRSGRCATAAAPATTRGAPRASSGRPPRRRRPTTSTSTPVVDRGGLRLRRRAARRPPVASDRAHAAERITQRSQHHFDDLEQQREAVDPRDVGLPRHRR